MWAHVCVRVTPGPVSNARDKGTSVLSPAWALPAVEEDAEVLPKRQQGANLFPGVDIIIS